LAKTELLVGNIFSPFRMPFIHSRMTSILSVKTEDQYAIITGHKEPFL